MPAAAAKGNYSMTTRKTLLTIAATGVLTLATPGLALAHFLWVEVEPRWELGRNGEIHVYFGEPHEFLREEAGGRLDQHDGLRAWVIGPKGTKTEVAVKKEINRFVGAFAPTAPGRHQVLVTSPNHSVVDLTRYGRGVVKPFFSARAQFLVFDRGRLSEREEEVREFAPLDLVPVTRALDPLKGTIVSRAGSEVVVRAILDGRPLAGRRVNALAPNGWLKELPATDSWGVTSFSPPWPGRYVLVILAEDRTPGRFHGKAYEVLEHRASLSILVDASD
jgi:hypothetical protein